jgi:low affinity Fe/Cu permease
MAHKTAQQVHEQRSGLMSDLRAWFARFAQATAHWTGHPAAFLLAAAVVVVWIVTGPLFNYSNTWQLVINTGTTIVTFLMVFLIQNTQNRDTMAIQLKLSELVLAMKGAKNKFAAIEDLSDKELEELHQECRTRAELTLGHLECRREKPLAAKPEVRAAAHRAKTSARRSARHA